MGAYEDGSSTGERMAKGRGKESSGRSIKQGMSPEGISNTGQRMGTMSDHFKAGRKMKSERASAGEVQHKIAKMEGCNYPPHLMGGDDHGDYQVPSHGEQSAHGQGGMYKPGEEYD
jgi:hypothetical protein